MDTNKLAYEMREMMYLFGKNSALKPKIEPTIRHHDMMFLKAIARLNEEQGTVKMGDLSKHFNISPPAVSQLIRRFETRGYIERVSHINDRRSVYICLSDAVIMEMKEVEACIYENLKRLITFLGEEDAQDLIRIMRKASEFREGEEE